MYPLHSISQPTIKALFSILFILFLLMGSSCQKLVDIPSPINTISDESAYSTDASASSVLNGLYVSMSRILSPTSVWTGLNSIFISTSLSADELYLSASGGPSETLFFKNSLINSISIGGKSWDPLYNYVYRCNAAINGLKSSQTLSASIKKQLLGEAYFLRAFYYFHLVNLFGPVPLAINTDYKLNVLLSRSSIPEVYKLIINDLKLSQEQLSEHFLNGTANGSTTERTRPTKWAATALLARAYLYVNDYPNATIQATQVIDNAALFNLVPLNDVFLKNNQEAIWQIQPTTSFWNTEEAKVFIIPSSGFSVDPNPFYLNPSLLNSVEPGDQRFTPGNWIDSIRLDDQLYYYPYKYKVNENNPDIIPSNGTKYIIEYLTLLRLAEVYLIRSEALANQGNLEQAITDLDNIRQRAGLPLIGTTNPSISKEALLDAILHERRTELFTEGGHRWFDLKRTGRIDAVMSVEAPLKGGTWESREALYPLTQSELQRAPNIKQSPGYPTIG